MKNKFTSRKFLTALSGVVTGIFLILMGDTTEGATAVVSSVVVYLAAEGLIDVRRLNCRNNDTAEKEEDAKDVL